MKFRKILLLALSLIIVSLSFASCGSVDTYSNVRFTAVTEDIHGKQTLLCGALFGDIQVGAGEDLNVIDASRALLEKNGIPFKLSQDGKSFTSIKSKSETTRNGYFYCWECEVNGEKLENVRPCDYVVYEDDVIVYYLRPDIDKSGVGDDEVDPDDTSDDFIEDETELEETEEAAE